jgi:hypothetical protein
VIQVEVVNERAARVAKIDGSAPKAIRDAINKVLAMPGNHRHGEKVLNSLVKAPGNQMSRQALWTQFGAGALSLQFGRLCRRVALEVGDPDPPPYALTDTISLGDGTKALRLKPSVVKGIND